MDLVIKEDIGSPVGWWKTSRARQYLDCGNTKIWELAKSGKLPKPIKTAVGVRWDARALIEFVEAETKRAREAA